MTCDTSAIVAAIDHRDSNHAAAIAHLGSERGLLVVPTPILTEITYYVEQRFGLFALNSFLTDVSDGAYTMDCCEADMTRVRELIVRYADLPLGFADASVIACAERRGGRTLTFDFRHFGVVAREGRIQLLH